MGTRLRLGLTALATGAAITAAGLALAGPAAADDDPNPFNCASLCDQLHTFKFSGAVADLWYRIDSDGHLQALANVQNGVGGVQARALCKRRNGGTAWYESTIRSTSSASASHYDCASNSTYNYSIVGNGAEWTPNS